MRRVRVPVALAAVRDVEGLGRRVVVVAGQAAVGVERQDLAVREVVARGRLAEVVVEFVGAVRVGTAPVEDDKVGPAGGHGSDDAVAGGDRAPAARAVRIQNVQRGLEARLA